MLSQESYENTVFISFVPRNLREARDMAISEKERALISERETNAKYEQMLQEYV